MSAKEYVTFHYDSVEIESRTMVFQTPFTRCWHETLQVENHLQRFAYTIPAELCSFLVWVHTMLGSVSFSRLKFNWALPIILIT